MTAPMLESYVAGRWFAAADDLADAVVALTFSGLRTAPSS